MTDNTPPPEEVELNDIINGLLQHYKARWNRLDPGEEYDESLPDLDRFEASQALIRWREAYADKARIDELERHAAVTNGITDAEKCMKLLAKDYIDRIKELKDAA